jgi:hypothetical protein
LWALASAACGGSDTSSPTTTTQPPAAKDAFKAPPPPKKNAISTRGYQVVTQLGPTGSVQGTIRFKGEVPVNKPVVYHQSFRERQAKDYVFCDAKNVKKDKLVILQGGVGNTLVEIQGISSGKDFPKSAILENRDCRFTPRLVLSPRKKRLVVANRDPIMHNAQIVFHESVFWNQMLPPELKTNTPKMIAPGLYEVGCSLHDWMKAYVQVMAHPYFAVSAMDGTFRVTDVPVGTYALRTWHEKLGTETRPITIQADAVTKIDLDLDLGP